MVQLFNSIHKPHSNLKLAVTYYQDDKKVIMILLILYNQKINYGNQNETSLNLCLRHVSKY